MEKNKNKKNVKNNTNKKVNTSKKVAANNHKPAKKVTPQKPNNKKVAKKVAPKKVEPAKKVQPKPTPKPVETKKPTPEVKKEVTKEEKLERTMIFDGTQRKNLADVVNKMGEEKIVLKDKVVKRSKFNRYVIYALIVLILATIVYSYFGVRKEIKKSNQKNEPTSFERLNADELGKNGISDVRNTASDTGQAGNVEIPYPNLKTITVDEFEVKVAEGEKMIVMISSETCSFSIVAEKDYNQVLSEEKRIMYRLDITTMTDEENTRLRNYYPYTATPTVIAVKDGAVVSEVEGRQSISEFRSWVKNNS